MIKRWIISLLAAMAVAVAFLPMTKVEVSADTVHNHEDWTAWAASEHGGKLPDTAGNYYLTEDVALSGSWSVPSGDTKLCLNGHVIGLGTVSGYAYNVIEISTGNTLNLYDCGSVEHYFLYNTEKEWTYIAIPTTDQISGAISKDSVTDATVANSVVSISGGAIIGTKHSAIGASGTLNVYGGNIVGNIGSEGYWQAPILITNNGTCNMYDGNVIGNTGTYGGVVVYSGYFNMYGGAISYNVMQGGGGIYATDNGVLIRMEGGTISHNKATTYEGGGVYTGCDFVMTGGSIEYNSSTRNGGGVYVSGNHLFKMSGGSIIGNTSAGKGGGVYTWGDQSLIVGGTAQITGNKKNVGNVAVENNCEIDSGKSIIIGTGDGGNGVDVPVTGTSGMKVGVTKVFGATTYDKAINNALLEYMECFSPDDDNIIRFKNNGTPEDTTDDYFECAQQFSITNGSSIEDKGSNNGYIIVDTANVCTDDIVTVTVCPNTGYSLKNNSLSVKNANGGYGVIAVTKDATDATKYTFVMRDYNVTVSAEFEAIPTSVNLCNGEPVINNAIEFPANPAFGSYIFAGWYDAKIGGNKVELFVPGKDYYAYWKRNVEDEHFILTLEKGIQIVNDSISGKNILSECGVATHLDADILDEKYGISFDAEANTLSLNNAAIVSYSSETQICALYISVERPITVDVTGDCVLGGKNNNEYLPRYGIKAYGASNITVTGSGKLTINVKDRGSGSSYGIYTESGNIAIDVSKLDIYGAYSALYTTYNSNTEIAITGSEVIIDKISTAFSGYDADIINARLTVSNIDNVLFGNWGTTSVTESTLILQGTNGSIECRNCDVIIDNCTIACDLPDSGAALRGEKAITLKGSPIIYDSPSDKTTFSVDIGDYYSYPTIDLKDYAVPEGGAKIFLKCKEDVASDLAEYGPITVVTNVGTGANTAKMPTISHDCEGGYLGFVSGTAGATDIALHPADIDINLTGEGENRKLEVNFGEAIEGMSYQWLEAETTEGAKKGKGITILTEVNEITGYEDAESFGDIMSYSIGSICEAYKYSSYNSNGGYTGLYKVPSELASDLIDSVGLTGVEGELYVPMVLVTQKDFDLNEVEEEALEPLMTSKDKFNISIKTTGGVNKTMLYNLAAYSTSDMFIELMLSDNTFSGTIPMGIYLVFMTATGDAPAISEFQAEVMPTKAVSAITKPSGNTPASEIGEYIQEYLFAEILGFTPSPERTALSAESNGVYTNPMLASEGLVTLFTSEMGYQIKEGEKLYIPMYMATSSGFDFDTVTEDELMTLIMGGTGTGELSLNARNTDKVMFFNVGSLDIIELTKGAGDAFEGNVPVGLYMVILSSDDAEVPVVSDIDYSAPASPSATKIDENSIIPIPGKTGEYLNYNLTIKDKAYGCRISTPQNGCIAPQSMMTRFVLSDYNSADIAIAAEADGFVYGTSGKTGYKNIRITDDLYTEAQLTKAYYKDNGAGASPRWELLDTVPTEAGNYKVVIAVPESEGIGNVSTEVSFAIAKADVNMTAPTAKTLTDNGQAQALITAGTVAGGRIEYALGENASSAPTDWSDDILVGTEAKIYFAWYRVVGDANHNDIAPICIQVRINAAYVPSEPEDEDLPEVAEPTPDTEEDPEETEKSEEVGDDIISDNRTLVIEDTLSEDSDTESVVATIEAAVTENDAKDIILKADEKTVTEQGIENKAYADAATEIITEVTKESDSKTVILAEDVMKTLAKAERVDSLTVMTSVADVEFDTQAIEAVNKQSGGDVKLVVTLVKEEIARNAEENNKVYFEVSLIKEDGTEITAFDGGSIKVTLPIPKASQNETVVVVYSDGKGHYSPVDGKINENGTFTFVTKHLSEYVLMTQREAEPLYNHIFDFGTLKLHAEEITENTVVLKWDRYEDADGYIVYGNFCNCDGKIHKVKKLATIDNTSITEYTVSGLEEGTRYKFRVRAYKIVNGKRYVTVKSRYTHLVTKGGNWRVTSDIQISQEGMKKNNALTLKRGKEYDINAVRYNEAGKKVHHVNIRYESSDSLVATVSKEGKITAIGTGKCTVLVIAENGVYEEIAVNVK